MSLLIKRYMWLILEKEITNVKLFCKLKCVINEYFLVVTSYSFNINGEPDNLIAFSA